MGNCNTRKKKPSKDKVNHLLREVEYSVVNKDNNALRKSLRNHVDLAQYKGFVFFLLRSCFYLEVKNIKESVEIIDKSDEQINLDWNLKSPSYDIIFNFNRRDSLEDKSCNYLKMNGKESLLYKTKDELKFVGCDGYYHYAYNKIYTGGDGLSVEAYIIYLKNIARQYRNSEKVIKALDYVSDYIHYKRRERRRIQSVPATIDCDDQADSNNKSDSTVKKPKEIMV